MMRSKRESAARPSRGKNDLSQLGLFGVPGMGGLEDDDDDDPELEAELMSILSSGGAPALKTSAPKKARGSKAMPQGNLDQMIAQSMKDVSSGEDSSGEDDPSLLAELEQFTGGSESKLSARPPASSEPASALLPLLTERLQMYKEAEEIAKNSGDTAKARRLSRGVKTLEDLKRKAERGGVIDENEIPLPVSLKKAQTPTAPLSPAKEEVKIEDPSPPVPPPRRSVSIPKIEEPPGKPDNTVLAVLRERLGEYKRAAVIAKKAGDMETAKAHVRVIKQFESVISSVEGGQSIDMSTMPPSPFSGPPEAAPQPPPPAVPPRQAPPPPLPPTLQPSPPQAPQPSEQSLQQSGEIPAPASVLEALEQRLAVFKKQEETAKTDGNSSKARRMGRISKQYEDAIKLHKAGKDIPVDDLPTPPGFPPIPVDKKPVLSPPVSPGSAGPPPASPRLAPPVSPLRPASPSPVPAPPSPTPSSSTTTSISPKPSGRSTRQEKQLAVLLKRQKEWKEAAIAAKKAGDLAKAKDCLRQVKGFDPLIEATNSGLPVDLTTIPVPPKDKVENVSDFEVVNVHDCLPGSNSEIYEQLKADLKKQFKMSMETRQHYKNLGDVGNANKFEQLAVHTKKDLDRISVLQERDDPVPRYHYEMRTFSILRSNTDLNDNDLELSIIQGVSYNVPNPKEIDTYVRYEFPYPSEEPRKDKTSTVYNTNNPEYNYVTVVPILRANRACQRVFKRHSLKLEVWSKGGFLRSDTLVGTVSVKLQPLETKCCIHDSFNVMDGRRPLGGKLEVKIRIRQPIQENEIEQVKEKWLLID